MGLVGWADTPNKIDGTKQHETPAAVVEVEEVVVPNSQIEESDESLGVLEGQSNDCLVTNDATEPELAISAPYPGNQLLTAIHNLRLTKRESEESVVDISKFELHELLFLYEHVSRTGQIDPYDFVCEIFAVKHRVMDEVGDIDSVSSPNLDELLKFAEEKYQESVSQE